MTGVAVPAFVALAWSASVRGFGWLRSRWALVAALVFLVVGFLPFLVAYTETGSWSALQLLWRESVVRAVRPFDHVEPWWFYLWNQFELMAPVSLLLPAALAHVAWRAVRLLRADGLAGLRRLSEAQRRRVFPALAYLAIFAFFTLSRSRRTYYLLPVVPFAALILADALERVRAGYRDRLTIVGLRGIAALAVLGVLAVAAAATALTACRALPFCPPSLPSLADVSPAAPGILLLFGAAILATSVLLWRRSDPRSGGLRAGLAPLVGVLALVSLFDVAVIGPARARANPLPAFGATVRRAVPPGTPVELVGIDDAKLLFYLCRPVVRPRDHRATDFRVVRRSGFDRAGSRRAGWVPAGGMGPEEDAARYLLLRRVEVVAASAQGP
jgi:4-amino-4-deoxy-L-arabinose transferase-like glycosyltransferase